VPATARMKSTHAVRNKEVLQLLGPIVALLQRSGVSDSELVHGFSLALKKARSSKDTIKVLRLGSYYQRGELTDRWIRDPKYTNAAGKPLDLPIRGATSLASLAKDSGVTDRPTEILSMLLKFGNVVKVTRGRYRLVKRYMNYKASGLLPFEPNYQFLIDAISAATRGMGSLDPNQSLYWLNAEHKYVPASCVGEFLEYLRSRGVIFLHEVNDWLDQHAIDGVGKPRSGARVRRVGVGLFPISSRNP